MEALRARYESDAPHQHFVTDHHSIVWGEGDLGARLMFIGEAPGEEEDKSGRPFVGRAGQLLDKMIAGMGLKREQVYIANVLKTRPPGNATPTESESSLCAPYLIEQIEIVGPEVIVTLGLPATRVILRSMATMGSLRGTWANLTLPDGRVVEVMPTYHPAYVLRSYTEEVRGKVWSDLKLAKARLGIE
jgi:DNA polymerase